MNGSLCYDFFLNGLSLLNVYRLYRTMTEDSSSLFTRLAQKMGYYDKDGQDKKVCHMLPLQKLTFGHVYTAVVYICNL